MSLTFNTLRGANMARLPQFRDKQGRLAHSQPDGSDWSPAQWLQAVVGELGELANVLKKIDRGDFHESEMPRVMDDVRKEFADVITYMDIFAHQFRIDLGQAVIDKFNEVSRRVGSNVFIHHDGDSFQQVP